MRHDEPGANSLKMNSRVRGAKFAPQTKSGTRYMPYAFMEPGEAMLSSVLNSEVTINININIMRVFILVRRMLTFIVLIVS